MNLQIRRAAMALLLSVMCFAAYAQKTVTGTVKDATGEPMIGVSILVDGTAIGGITDFDGNFTIKDVPEKGVLKITYIGYKDQKIAVAGKNSFNITMEEDAASLDEVVVVGYGTMKKKDLTGAVANVKTEDLVSRISGRRMCKNGHVFHVVTKPPKAEGVCDVCGEPLYQRPDDCEATVQTRLDAYEKSTAPLIGYYEQKGVLCRIDGNDEIQNVSKAMIAAIDEVM